MLREENSFQIAGLRVAIATVADGAAETAILIKKTRAVADEGAHGGAGLRLGSKLKFTGGAGEIKKEIAAVRLEVEQAEIALGFLATSRFDVYGCAPEKL